MVKTAILEVLVSGVSVGLHLSQNNTDNCLYRIYSLLRCLIIINITNVILCCKCQMSRLALSNIKDPLMAPRLETFSAASGQKSRSLKCFETNARMKEKMNFLHFLFHQEKVSKVLRSQIDFDTPIHFRSKPLFSPGGILRSC